MTLQTAYWCIVAAALLPYVWAGIAKTRTKGYDNRDPRGWMLRQNDARVHRANGAQANAFEAFPAFAASVVLAQLSGVAADRVALLAVVFVVMRVMHGVFYVTDRPRARSLAWAGGIACVVALLVQAAMTVRA